ncbi:Alba DNA/RNA-binding protein [Zea mays]|uniref:Alba DNA/RNA-binding protein n=1 Tax=Zea mays TaxID=4577 RepID=A0A1D6FF14_MAIZE|nr:Alba DNA/RNA-binding protein [Zea mays]
MVEEEITEGLKNLTVTGDAAASGGEGQRRGGGISSNRIQVSNTKKPLFFYVNLAKVRTYGCPFPLPAASFRDVDVPSPRFRFLTALVGWLLACFGSCRGICSSTAMWSCPLLEWVRPCNNPLSFFLIIYLLFISGGVNLGMAACHRSIATVVTVAEILKNNGFAVEKKIRTSTVDINDESRGRPFQKAKIEIILGKSDRFNELMAAAAEERGEVEEGEEQA